MNTLQTEDTYGLSFSDRLPLAFTHGKGSTVWDEAGNPYLDFTSGWGVTCLGHAHPVIVEALATQAGRLMQGPNAGFTYSPERAALLRTLHRALPVWLPRVYFCNSGAEANDAALKLARKITGRHRVLSTRGGFHGRSLATLSVSRGPENLERFRQGDATTTFLPFGDETALRVAMDDGIAALIVEPVQGEGGVRVPPAQWLSQARALCDRHGALLILDEIQTGFCRTGRFFGHQHSPVPIEADFMTMAKGIAGGFPFAAFAVHERIVPFLEKDDHGGTYCGNPLGCTVANAVVSYLLQHDVARRVEASGRLLQGCMRELLESYPGLFSEIRALGLLCALQLRDGDHVRTLTLRCAKHGLLVVPTRGGVLRLLPDLLVSEADIRRAIEILAGACVGLENEGSAVTAL